eukprot:CAMPEP_0174278040 /NCGR_PEP_ID=MMETSP0439-20130205/61258_1 /TAXON_ID=0 /ORGANISM="Stereomyxa ramosa, Strain Chinc5" /LENGTH=523 /DNA_ID=CAMNT_0015370411 /DNA_START=462 /DNA_END=2030 /DNA_ORIENTATION=-
MALQATTGYKEDIVITTEECEELFAIIGGIYTINTHFLEELESAFFKWPEVQSFGQIFKKSAAAMKFYVPYINAYPSIVEIMKKLNERPKFNAFDEEMRLKYGLNFNSHMITPIQRLPRYELLLRDLIKFTPENHCDYEILTQAMSVVKQLNNSVNERSRQFAACHSVVEVQGLISKPVVPLQLVAPHRSLICRCSVTEKLSKRTSIKRELFVFSDMIVIATPNSTNTIYDYFTTIMFTMDLSAICTDSGDTPIMFLQTSGKQFSLLFSTLTEAEKTVGDINNAVKSHFKNHPAQKQKQKPNPDVFEKQMRQVQVHLVEGIDLDAKDFTGYSDPFALIRFQGRKKRTSVVWKNLNPVWDELFTFNYHEKKSPKLAISVWDREKVGHDDKIGRVVINLNSIGDFYKCKSVDITTKKGAKAGRIRLRIWIQTKNILIPNSKHLLKHQAEATPPLKKKKAKAKKCQKTAWSFGHKQKEILKEENRKEVQDHEFSDEEYLPTLTFTDKKKIICYEYGEDDCDLGQFY